MLHAAALFCAVSMANADMSTGALRGSEESAPIDLATSNNFANALTPHGADEPTEALALLRQLCISQLTVPQWQWLVSLVTLLLGALLLWDPKGIFEIVVVILVFCLAYIMVLGSLHERYHTDGNGMTVWEVVLAIELAFCAAVIAWKGFKGIELVIGMTIGLWPMRFIQVNLVSLGIFGDSPWWNIIIISLSGSLGIWLNADDAHRLTLIIGYLLPVLGGRLVSSTIGWLALVVSTQQVGQVWLNFWKSLPLDVYDPSVQHVNEALLGAPGIGWSNLPFLPGLAGYGAGCAIWLVLSLIAVIAHHHKVKNGRQARVSQKSDLRKGLMA